MATTEDGVAATTRYDVVATNGARSLVRCQLITGRTHQIRVHLAHAGHPIIGDDKYGDFALNRKLKQRLLLHSAKLAFIHPTTGEPMKLESVLPDEMRAFVDQALA
jgi:23S rRNA pseudouridine955/2504/2580 synthase